MALIDFSITTPEGIVYASEATSVTADTRAGQITILPQHIPLLASIGAGEIVVRNNSEEVSLAVHGGFVEVLQDSVVRVLADGALKAEDIDEKRLQEAIARAEKLKEEQTDPSSIEYARVAALLEKELARLRVLRKRKKI